MNICTNLDEWIEELVDASNELAASLGLPGGIVLKKQTELPQDMTGSSITLVGEATAMQVGLIADEQQSRALAGALLCMESTDAELTKQDVIDALGEVANILGGAVKSRMAKRGVPPMQLGLPIFLEGHIQVGKSVETAVVSIRWDQIEAKLLLLLQQHGG